MNRLVETGAWRSAHNAGCHRNGGSIARGCGSPFSHRISASAGQVHRDGTQKRDTGTHLRCVSRFVPFRCMSGVPLCPALSRLSRWFVPFHFVTHTSSSLVRIRPLASRDFTVRLNACFLVSCVSPGRPSR